MADAGSRRPAPNRCGRLLVPLLAASVLVVGCGPRVTITIGPEAAAGPARVEMARDAELPFTAPVTDSGDVARPAARTGVSQAPLFARLRLAPATRLRVPAIDLDVPVEEVSSARLGESWLWPVPEDAAGHHLGTANPGEPGNIVISGHVDTRRGPGIFARLSEVKAGDTVTLESADGRFTYRVESVSVVPEADVSVMLQVPSERLTLITCVADGAYEQRLVVRAVRAEDG